MADQANPEQDEALRELEEAQRLNVQIQKSIIGVNHSAAAFNKARAGLWAALTLGVVVLAALGIAWSLWWWFG